MFLIYKWSFWSSLVLVSFLYFMYLIYMYTYTYIIYPLSTSLNASNNIHNLWIDRGMMWEHNTDLAYTSTLLNKRKRLASQWNATRSYWTGRSWLRFFLPRSSTGQRNIISNISRKVAGLASSNLLLKAAMTQSDATVS